MACYTVDSPEAGVEQAGMAAQRVGLAAVAQVAPPLSEGPHTPPLCGRDLEELVLQHLWEWMMQMQEVSSPQIRCSVRSCLRCPQPSSWEQPSASSQLDLACAA